MTKNLPRQKLRSVVRLKQAGKSVEGPCCGGS